MPLPTCICVAGQPPFARLGDIFCALSQIDLACVVPTLLSATIVDDVLTLVFSEDVSGFTPGANGFELTVDGNVGLLDYVSGDGTTTVSFTSDFPAGLGDTVLLTYVPGNVNSGAECPLAGFVDEPVTNNTGLTFNYLRPGGVDGYFRPGGVDTYIRP